MKRNNHWAIAALWAVLCLALILTPRIAAAAERRVVRVGFFAFDGYHMQAEDGTRSGYGYELLQHIVGYTDWQYAYVGYDKSWSEMQDMLANGEIDLLTSAQKTPERMERFDFSAQSIGTSAAILTVRSGETRYMLEDSANWSGMRIGMMRGNSRNQSLAAYARERGFTYTPVYYDDTDQMVEDMKAGNGIDAVLTSNLRRVDGEWILAQFDSSPFYVMVRKGDGELLSQVDYALGELYNTEPELRTQLMNRYYAPSSGEEIAFSADERAYVQAMRDVTLLAALNPDCAPYSFLRDGQPAGILYDVAMELIERCGLKVSFVPVASREEYEKLVEAGGVDLRFDAGYQYAEAERLGYRLTVPYLDTPISRLFRTGSHGFSTAAIPRNMDMLSRFQGVLAQRKITVNLYESPREAAEAVLSGQADMAYLNAETAGMVVRDEPTNRLVAEELHGYGNHYAVAVNGERSPLLFSILNKTVASLGDDTIDTIKQKYVDYSESSFSLIGLVYDNPLAVVGLVAALFVTVGSVAVWVHMAQDRRRNAEKLAEQERRAALLAEALAVAERADAAKSQFLSSVSHEMRTPLNAIIGFMELVKGADARQTEAYLADAELAAKQLLSVINDVLDMSSIESGKLKLAHQPFNFKRQISSVSSIYQPLCTQKGIEFETKLLTPIDEWLVGDELRVNQILMNLLNNAVKFTDSGHIWLSVSQKNVGADRAFIRAEVADTGCGMGEDMQARLFKPFEQGDVTTARKYGGSGLGLSIVKSLVTMMEGAIRVESRQGEGSVFTVDMPFVRGSLWQDAQLPGSATGTHMPMGEALATAPGKPIPRDYAGMRVLLAEDNAMNRTVAEGLLKRQGIQCDTAEDGRVAVEKFLASRPGEYDAILMDIQMPRMDGFEATKAIREAVRPDAGAVQIIALTANAFNEDVAKALSSGMNAHVAKPIEPELLTQALENAFEVRRKKER